MNYETLTLHTRRAHLTVMRLGKPMEHLQAALKAQAIADPILKITATIRQLGYAIYLINDHLSWVGHVHSLFCFTK